MTSGRARSPRAYSHGFRAIINPIVAALVTWSLLPCVAAGDDQTEPTDERRTRFVVVVGGALVDFDINFRHKDFASGLTLFIDASGDLGLPEAHTVPSASLLARVSARDFVVVTVTPFRRFNDFEVDETIVLDDLEIHAGAAVAFRLDSDDIDVSWGRRLHEDDRLRVIGKLGVYLLDLRGGLWVDGSYSVGGDLETGTYERTLDLLAPLPLIGVQFDFDIDDRWTLVTAVDAIYLPVGDISGAALRTNVRARVALGRVVGLSFGVTYFDIEVRQEVKGGRNRIDYGYKGFFGGLYFAF